MKNRGFRQTLIWWVTFLGGLYFFLEFVLPNVVIEELGVNHFHEGITKGVIAVGSMAFALGIINLLLVHGSKIAFRRDGWGNSSALILGLFLMMGVTTLDWWKNEEYRTIQNRFNHLALFAERILSDSESGVGLPVSERLPFLFTDLKKALSEFDRDDRLQSAPSYLPLSDQKALTQEINEYQEVRRSLEKVINEENIFEPSVESNEEVRTRLESLAGRLNSAGVLVGRILRLRHTHSRTSQLWDFLYSGLFVSLGSAMFSLLGVYIAAAAFRAFRVRTFESSLMMGAALIVMLGQIPFGIWLSESLPDARRWLLEIPNSAAFRAITIGAGVAALIMAFRMWLSLESDFEEGGGA